MKGGIPGVGIAPDFRFLLVAEGEGAVDRIENPGRIDGHAVEPPGGEVGSGVVGGVAEEAHRFFVKVGTTASGFSGPSIGFDELLFDVLRWQMK